MVLSRMLARGKLLEFFAAQPACLVALEACSGPLTGRVSYRR